jgi:hypothetical protein
VVLETVESIYAVHKVLFQYFADISAVSLNCILLIFSTYKSII